MKAATSSEKGAGDARAASVGCLPCTFSANRTKFQPEQSDSLSGQKRLYYVVSRAVDCASETRDGVFPEWFLTDFPGEVEAARPEKPAISEKLLERRLSVTG